MQSILRKAFLIFSILIFLSSITIVVSANENFSIVVLPDTQHYSESYPQIFTNQTQWIVDNKDRLNIKFVIHEGDIVEDANNDTQWRRANESISILDGKIPYGILPGNHDENITQYKKYFPAKRYKNYSYWEGSYNHNRNNYQLFSALGTDFIIVNLGWKPSSDGIQWANSIIQNHSGRKAILVTHGYLNKYAIRDVHGLGDTSYIWNDLIVPNKNVFLVLCGHAHAESRRADQVDGTVHQVLANYQGRSNGGNGWLRIMEFEDEGNEITVKTFSPFLNKYEKDKNSEFKLEEKPLQPDLLDIILWKIEKTFKMVIETVKRLYTSLTKTSLLSFLADLSSSPTAGLLPSSPSNLLLQMISLKGGGKSKSQGIQKTFQLK